MRSLFVVVACVGCADPASDDVVGPYTGPVHHYLVDSIVVPGTNTDARLFGDDLTGDNTVDNQLGIVCGQLASNKDVTTHGRAMIASGVLASTLDLQADTLDNDATVAVTYNGAEGDQPTLAGGTLIHGAFRSNRTYKTHVPGKITAHLPLFADADPVAIELDGVEIDLTPDGIGGFDGYVRGGAPVPNVYDAAFKAMVQMITADPRDHRILMSIIDANQDGVITLDELKTNSLFQSLLAPDIQMFQDGVYAPTGDWRHFDRLSFGYKIHVSDCANGCALPAAEPCFDRVLDGDETAVDCGGTCALGCPTQAACVVPSDCQSQACDSGHCRAPTCSDGVADGAEPDVDCGAMCPTHCALGKRCELAIDCASQHCTAHVCATQ